MSSYILDWILCFLVIVLSKGLIRFMRTSIFVDR